MAMCQLSDDILFEARQRKHYKDVPYVSCPTLEHISSLFVHRKRKKSFFWGNMAGKKKGEKFILIASCRKRAAELAQLHSVLHTVSWDFLKSLEDGLPPTKIGPLESNCQLLMGGKLTIP